MAELAQSPVLPKLRLHFRLSNDQLVAEGDLNAIQDSNNIDRVYLYIHEKDLIIIISLLN